MNIPMWLTFLILIVDIGLLLSDTLRIDLVALLTVVALGITGILTPQEAFSGFSRSAVITIIAIFILAEGLQRANVSELVGDWLLKVAGVSESRLITIVMLAGATLSLFMNNIAAASILLPAVMNVAQKTKISPSRLLMPLAFATILGGMATLLTTTNIVISTLLRDQKLTGYGLLDFAPLGLPIVAIGIIYMIVVGRHLLPSKTPINYFSTESSDQENLLNIYRLNERLFRMRVPRGSFFKGKSLAQSRLRSRYGINILSIEHDKNIILAPSPHSILAENDILLCVGKQHDYHEEVEPYLEILPSNQAEQLESSDIIIAEVVLAPRSKLIGQTLKGSNFREKYQMNVLAMWHKGKQLRTELSNKSLNIGDALLLQGQRKDLHELRTNPDFIILTNDKQSVPVLSEKVRTAIFIMAVALLLGIAYPALVGEMMLGGALAMVLAGILNMDQAYQAVEWKNVFFIAGMLPMGIAISKTGAATFLAQGSINWLGLHNNILLLTVLFILTLLLSQTMNGATVGTIIAPIAIQAAQHIGANPRSMAMGIALATSMTFITPLGHPVNVLVMGPGNYSFRDYFKVGLPLTIILFITVILLLPIFWPL